MLQSYRGIDFHPLLRGSLEGIEPSQAARLFTLRDTFRRGVLKHVRLHARLQRRYANGANRGREVKDDLKRAGFSSELVRANLKGLRRVIERLHWHDKSSVWSDYREDNTYTDADMTAKSHFVERACALSPRRQVCYLGANDGHFSRIAARHSDFVVAFDSDHLSVEKHYRRLARERNLEILPLVMGLANPRRPMDGGTSNASP